MNTFLGDYIAALEGAQITAGQNAGTIIQIVDPVKTKNVELDNVLTALSTALAFIPGPTAAIGKVLVTAAQVRVPRSPKNTVLISYSKARDSLKVSSPLVRRTPKSHSGQIFLPSSATCYQHEKQHLEHGPVSHE
jgi:hypothetical protein